MTRAEYYLKRQALITYLEMKTREGDWHAVSDAANDLRVMEAAWMAAHGHALHTESYP